MGYAKYAPASALMAVICIGVGLYMKPGPPHVSNTPFAVLEHPDTYRQRDMYQPEPQFPPTPTHIYLVRLTKENDYALIDAGCAEKPLVADILAAVREATKDGKLRLLLLTHGHVDHVGATPALAAAYPDMQVVMHVDELPYVLDRKSYLDVPGIEFPGYLYAHSTIGVSVSSSLPPRKVLIVAGKQGDLSSAAGEGGEAPKWPIPTGVLTYFHIPGHSPGQLAWTHVPSKTVFGGDIFEILLTKTPAKTPGITLTWPIFTANLTHARLSAIDFAKTADYTHIHPAHDVTDKGATKAEVLAFAKDLETTGGPDPFSFTYE